MKEDMVSSEDQVHKEDILTFWRYYDYNFQGSMYVNVMSHEVAVLGKKDTDLELLRTLGMQRK